MYESYLMTGIRRALNFVCLMFCIALCGVLGSCTTTSYVPVETVRVEYDSKADTIIRTDTVRSEKETIIREANVGDSLLLAKLGIKLQSNERLLIFLQRELAEAKSNIYESRADTVYKEKDVQVPVPVERKLSRWERFCLDYGKVTTGCSFVGVVAAALMLIRWIRRKGRK